METTHIPFDAAGPRVADVMLTAPEAYGPEATVADAHTAFASPRHKLLLVADSGTYVGVVTRADVAEQPADAPLAPLAGATVTTLAPDTPTEDAIAVAAAEDASRVPVVSAEGALVGLLCVNGTRRTFCVRA